MQSFKTCAGTSSLDSEPEPRASKPTQSIAPSTQPSECGRICAMWSLTEPSWRRSIVSQPKERACARRSGIMSPTMTHAAPRRWHDAAAARPTGPAPATYTVAPGLTSAWIAPWKPVGKMSLSSVRSLIFSSACARSGNLRRLKSAYGTMTYSDWPPIQPPMST